jgi:predicted HicB family RNase H-like nuclease
MLNSFNFFKIICVRIPPDVHRKLQIQAAEANISINRLISAKLSGYKEWD